MTLFTTDSQRFWATDSEFIPFLCNGVRFTNEIPSLRLPKLPFIVKARFVSKKAEEKIKAAGGVVKLVA